MVVRVDAADTLRAVGNKLCSHWEQINCDNYFSKQYLSWSAIWGGGAQICFSKFVTRNLTIASATLERNLEERDFIRGTRGLSSPRELSHRESHSARLFIPARVTNAELKSINMPRARRVFQRRVHGREHHPTIDRARVFRSSRKQICIYW